MNYDDNALYKLAYGEDHELMPDVFCDFEFLGDGEVKQRTNELRMIRFLARRVYELENK